MVEYSRLFKHFPQFVVIYTVKAFGVINKAEVFWNSVAFSMILGTKQQQSSRKHRLQAQTGL